MFKLAILIYVIGVIIAYLRAVRIDKQMHADLGVFVCATAAIGWPLGLVYWAYDSTADAIARRRS